MFCTAWWSARSTDTFTSRLHARRTPDALDVPSLVTLRVRPDTLYVTQNRTALATAMTGFIEGGSEHGLFIYQTRFLSRYRYAINGQPPQPIALSNVEQHSWLGYYGIPSPNAAYTEDGALGPGGKLAQ